MVAARTHNDPTALEAAHTSLAHLARDHARVPISWSTAATNGFSPPTATSPPWMRPLPDASTCNAAAQRTDKRSVLGFWKRMLAVRRAHNDLLVHGQYDDLAVDDDDVYVFTKTWEGRRALVVCNFTAGERAFEVPGSVRGAKRELLVSSFDDDDNNNYDDDVLRAWEGRVYLLAGSA
jgi:oligo-1,6-glucosidase